MGFDTGLPLQELAANMRYDLAPVPFMLGGLLLLLGGPSLKRAAGAGALFGIATLMQFYGAFAIPAGVAFIGLEALPGRRRLKLAAALVGLAALIGLPYGLYIAAHFDDFRSQAGTVDKRDDFNSPSFFVNSLIHEPDRFLRPLGFKEVPKGEDPRLVEPRLLSLREMAVRRPSAKLGVLVGLPVALAFAGWRAFGARNRRDRLLFLALAALVLQYALFESLKLYIYWVPVVPLLCIGIAAAVLWLFGAKPDEDEARADGSVAHSSFETLLRSRLLRGAVVAGTLVCLLGVFAEGAGARLSGIRTASHETEYSRLGALIHETVPAGSKVVGSTSLWWALRDTDYRSYFMFFYLTSPNAGRYRTTIGGFLDDVRPQYLVLTRLGQEELDKHLSPADRQDLDAYKASNATLVKRLEGNEARSYGYVEIWRLNP
jgi:hypothetical protein